MPYSFIGLRSERTAEGESFRFFTRAILCPLCNQLKSFDKTAFPQHSAGDIMRKIFRLITS